jgi:hypothetical protein
MPSVIRSELLRAAPVQARAAATVEAILDAALDVLVAEGLPGFNTNSVARAGSRGECRSARMSGVGPEAGGDVRP